MQPSPKKTYLDAVVAELDVVSPGLRGTVWQRTSGNRLDPVAENDPASWILQVPDCWGVSEADIPAGTAKPGVKVFLEKVRATISQAQHSVDITGFGVDMPGSPAEPFPDGAFARAMGEGLKHAATEAASSGRRLKVRFLMGVLSNSPSDPRAFHHHVKQMLGESHQAVDLNVASMITRGVSSYNHTKFVLVDGQSVIHGGINWMPNYYYQNSDPESWSLFSGFGDWAPVTDLDMALRGPAALSAGKFLDVLWTWTCQNASINGKSGKAWLATNNGSLKEGIATLYDNVEPLHEGRLDVVSVGSLGYGIMTRDSASRYQPPAVTLVEQAACQSFGAGDNNETNIDGDFMTVNPDANALRALLECATTTIVLSQQDINGFVNFPLYHAAFDVRLLDALVAKMKQGVKVRIVLSNPARPDYSNIGTMNEPIRALFDRVRLISASTAEANQVMKDNLQLAPLRVSDRPTWRDDKQCRLHTKVVLVDDIAFYIGSRNTYPDTTQDHGFIIEDATAAQQLRDRFLDIEWSYSKKAAIYDWENTGLVTPQLS